MREKENKILLAHTCGCVIASKPKVRFLNLLFIFNISYSICFCLDVAKSKSFRNNLELMIYLENMITEGGFWSFL